jgi:hypothetical protein
MNREDMRKLISYGNVYSKDTKKKLSEITVQECLDFMDISIWNHTAVAVPVFDCQKMILISS